ncbi:hypothetical protein K1719_006354 [Acacia pycnantha]|nr:hypothetical protein K1719_006354 [Acacia pycnantha]
MPLESESRSTERLSLAHQSNFNLSNSQMLGPHPLEELFERLNPTPNCIISDRYIVAAADVARKFQIPRIIFDGANCFFLLCNQYDSKVHENVLDSEKSETVHGEGKEGSGERWVVFS